MNRSLKPEEEKNSRQKSQLCVLPEGIFLNVRFNPNTGVKKKHFIFDKTVLLVEHF